MKPKKIFIAFISLICMLTACEKQEIAYLDNIQLDKTYLAAPPSGGTVTLKVTATDAWNLAKDIVIGKDSNKADIYSELPTWIKASAVSGGAGETTITFTVEGAEYGREQVFRILCGSKEQYFIIRQGSLDITDATIAEANSAPDGKVLRLTGVITDWYSNAEQYGNYYVTDDTGTILIYGTADKDGKLKNYPVADWGLELGDVVTIEGPRGSYQGSPQMVDVTITKLVKSLIQLDKDTFDAPAEGTEFVVKAAYKGNGVFLTPDVDWISIAAMDYVKGTPSKILPNPADTAVVTLRVAPYDGAKTRQGHVNFNSSSSSGSSDLILQVSQIGAITDVTVGEAFAAADDVNVLYRVQGYVSSVNSLSKGRFYIKDYSGEIYGYNIAAAPGGSTDLSSIIAEGDVVTVVGYKTSYNGTNEIVGYLEDYYHVQEVTIAEFNAAEDATDVWYKITGVVTDDSANTEFSKKFDITTYGNFDLVDETGNVYVYGVKTGFNGESKKFGTLEVKEGDLLTIVATKTTYKGLVEAANAWFVSNQPADNPDPGEDPDPEETKGTLDNPYTASEIAAAILAGNTPEDNVYIKGKVSAILYTFSANYGTGTFWISDDGKAYGISEDKKTTEDPANDFECYSVKWFGGNDWVEGNGQVEVGDEVVIYGKTTLYKGIAETSGKNAWVYSINGKTE